MRDSFLRTVAALLTFFCPVSATPAQPPNPAIPVGDIVAYPTIVQTGHHPTLEWSIVLPDGAAADGYVHFIRQIQMPHNVVWDSQVAIEGQQLSSLALAPSGSRFELWTVQASPLTVHLLATTYVGAYVPQAQVAIRSEDPYSALPRTRADRPFFVDVTTGGIMNFEGYPESARGVSLIGFSQSYGESGTGANLDRYAATTISEESITTNGTRTWTVTPNVIPSDDVTNARGEMRFTVFSREDYLSPASIVHSKFIQIWPVADAKILGIVQGQLIGSVLPEVSLELNDLYPSSSTWAQVYKGAPQTGATGTIFPGSSFVLNSSVPANRTFKTTNYSSVFDSNGQWTMEILTKTPFGTDRLASVSFTVLSPLEIWRQTHFGSPEASGAAADLEDFDKDGYSNLIEYAFGFDPTKNSAGQLPKLQRIGNNVIIGFTQPSGVSGISYGAEWSSTLLPESWSPISSTVVPPEYSFRMPLNNATNCYMRLKVTSP